ncbi:MAG: hypothetical protein L6Q99_21790 [Planctomycetes bacterium]|nr:hypothetical protein [Planctomycetota bacterium]
MTSRVRFRLAIDDAGEFLVVGGDRLVLGHASHRGADLPVLADLFAEHATFEFRPETFHAPASWRLSPARELVASGRELRVDGRVVRDAHELAHGERIEFSGQLAARTSVPVPESSTFLLEFERGAECLGAQRVLLLAPGPGGLVRIGRRARSHARVSRLSGDVRIFEDGGRLLALADGQFRLDDGELATEHRIVLPLDRLHTLTHSRAAHGEPPFVITLAPAH